MYVANYENWAFAQPAKDWCVSSYKAVSDTLQGIGEIESSGERKGWSYGFLGAVYFGIFSTLKHRVGIV